MDYQETNKELWNNKVAHHVASDFYNQTDFLNGKNSLNSIELELLGDVRGKKILHLQCHFGQDTLSLARMGANVTGIDFSEKAIEKAIEVSKELNLDARFICCDIYDTPLHLDEQFDIVFTSYGTIGWLPDLNNWAQIISKMLLPGGQLVFVEFHPAVWMFDNDFTTVAYDYCKSDPIIETTEGTYADKSAPIVNKSISWNHGVSEVFTALFKQNLAISDFQEYDYSPYNCLSHLEEVEKNKFRVAHFKGKIPLVYSFVAYKTTRK